MTHSTRQTRPPKQPGLRIHDPKFWRDLAEEGDISARLSPPNSNNNFSPNMRRRSIKELAKLHRASLSDGLNKKRPAPASSEDSPPSKRRAGLSVTEPIDLTGSDDDEEQSGNKPTLTSPTAATTKTPATASSIAEETAPTLTSTIKKEEEDDSISTASASPTITDGSYGTAALPSPLQSNSSHTSEPEQTTAAQKASDHEEQKTENVRKVYFRLKKRYDQIHTVASKVTASLRGVNLANLGELGAAVQELQKILDQDEAEEAENSDST